MGLSAWMGRRVQSWTTKPFPEGMPVASPASKAMNGAKLEMNDGKKSVTSTNVNSSLFSPAVNSAAANGSTESTASSGTPEEIAEKIMILIPYIKQYRSQGMLDEEIVAFLIEHSWPEYIVKKAVKNA